MHHVGVPGRKKQLVVIVLLEARKKLCDADPVQIEFTRKIQRGFSPRDTKGVNH